MTEHLAIVSTLWLHQVVPPNARYVYVASYDGDQFDPNLLPEDRQSPPNLLLEHFFDLSDLFLNFPGVLFDVAFRPYVRIVRNFAGHLCDFAFHFMNSAFNLILRTWGSSCFSLSSKTSAELLRCRIKWSALQRSSEAHEAKIMYFPKTMRLSANDLQAAQARTLRSSHGAANKLCAI
jgi:hypothetical protein